MIPVVFLSRNTFFLMHRLCFAVIRKDMVSSSQRGIIIMNTIKDNQCATGKPGTLHADRTIAGRLP